jgi:hypothetical protein
VKIRGLFLALPGACWWTFLYWNELQIKAMAKTDPMMYSMIREGRLRTSYAIATWVSLLLVAVGIAVLLSDLDRWRRSRTNE